MTNPGQKCATYPDCVAPHREQPLHEHVAPGAKKLITYTPEKVQRELTLTFARMTCALLGHRFVVRLAGKFPVSLVCPRCEMEWSVHYVAGHH